MQINWIPRMECGGISVGLEIHPEDQIATYCSASMTSGASESQVSLAHRTSIECPPIGD